MADKRTELEKEFDKWWSEDGSYIDPDTSDVPWFDKRKELCFYAFRAARNVSAPIPSVVPEWHPMDTAPRDGTFVICAHVSGHVNILQWSPYSVPHAGWRLNATNGHTQNPTHWMSLPAAPTPASLDDGGEER